MLAYNTQIWGNIQSARAMRGFDEEDGEDANSPEYQAAKAEFQAEMARAGNEVNERLNLHWQGMQGALKTASGLRPGSSIVRDSVSFKERLTTGQLYQRTRESLRDRVGRFIDSSSTEIAEDLVRPVPFASRFDVAYKLRRTSCQEKDVVEYFNDLERLAQSSMSNVIAAAEAGLPLICSPWEATQTLPLVEMMYKRLLGEIESQMRAVEETEEAQWSRSRFEEITAQRFEEAVQVSKGFVEEIKAKNRSAQRDKGNNLQLAMKALQGLHVERRSARTLESALKAFEKLDSLEDEEQWMQNIGEFKYEVVPAPMNEEVDSEESS